VEVVKGVRQVVLKLQHHKGDADSADEQILAVSSFEQVVIASSLNPSLFVEKGDILFKHQRYDEALTAYEHALQLDPTCLVAHQGKVQVLEEIRSLAYEKLYQLTVQPSERTQSQDDIQEDLE
jgi:tetratricopeptide (TPR) repeat protein